MTRDEFTFQRAVQENPFEITKAVDFTDSEIDSTWVDWPAPGGFAQWMNIRSPMARIVRGGKGTGRTHMMRRFSASVQAIRGNDPIAQVQEDGVLGVYVHCSGLNSARFRGRGITDEAWQSIFLQYADLWLAQAALEAFATVTVRNPPSDEVQWAISMEIHKLLQARTSDPNTSLYRLGEHLFELQREIDLAVNNAALNPGPALAIEILSNPGSLVFGVPNALRQFYEPLRNTNFLYLIDEFENFEASQQRYVNSLIREKMPGTSFMVGVRTYGLRTLTTLGGGEENREGSEYEEIRPDRNYIGGYRKNYQDFCQKVVARRLARYGFANDLSQDAGDGDFGGSFVVPPPGYEEKLIVEQYDSNSRPYFARLRRQLANDSSALGVVPNREDQIEFIVDAIRVPSRPLLEKVNAFLIYRAWADGNSLLETAKEIMEMRPQPDSDGLIQPNTLQKSVLDHYVTDLEAQLLNDMRRNQVYAGFRQFVTMSDGLPRNLLVILKNIYRWALFNGEYPFLGGKISLQSQSNGVLEATNWFIDDARPLGDNGVHVHDAIHRLGDMFRRLRFSDKPVESSLASFSADLSNCSPRAREVVQLAEHWTLLIPVEQGQKQRNTRLIESKYQLNRLLSPRWDLPTARRGAVALSAEEVNSIFDPEKAGEFRRLLDRRLDRMNAPFRVSRQGDGFQKTLNFEAY